MVMKQTMRVLRSIAAGVVLTVLYTSCIKDDGNTVTPTTNNSTNTASTSEERLLKLVNDVRKAGCNCGSDYYPPVGTVSWNKQLEQAALDHSKYMSDKNTLSHTGANNTDPGQRITAAGYSWMTYGENVASGYVDEEAVIKGWLNSPGHCKNIMNGKFVHIGVARSGDYWTQNFAAPK
ncbi:MAG: CAP domain-containing protein [Sphingobacteriales bacterium]|nr:MAG: CAP domain-containing protein [Sphingobacteriales bacterium]